MKPSSLLKLLKTEHEEIKKLFKKAEDCNKNKRPDVFQEIKEIQEIQDELAGSLPPSGPDQNEIAV